MKKLKDCWETFSIPVITDTGFLNDEDMVKLIFHCKKTNTYMNVYYPKNDRIDGKTISEIMKTALSVCLHCTEMKQLHDNEDI